MTDPRIRADRWMTTTDRDTEGGPVAVPLNRCPHCHSSAVERTRRHGLLKEQYFYCEECDMESLPIQPDDGY